MFARTLVYNTQRSAQIQLDGRRFWLRRVRFPEQPSPEWFTVDLLEHHDMAGASLGELTRALSATLQDGRWDRARLEQMACEYASKPVRAIVQSCLKAFTQK